MERVVAFCFSILLVLEIVLYLQSYVTNETNIAIANYGRQGIRGQPRLSAKQPDPPGDRFFFTRIIKTGSITLSRLFQSLAEKNHFLVVDSQRHWETGSLKEFVRTFFNYSTPLVFIQHISYIDFAEVGGRNPVYLTLVRDPVEKFVSNFYYRRRPDRKSTLRKIREKSKMSDASFQEWLDKDPSSCILDDEDHECSSSVNTGISTLVHIFCGVDAHCRQLNSTRSLSEAKKNLEFKYSFVGVLEEMEDSLKVLEHLYPRMFQGILEKYKENEKRHDNATPRKNPLTEAAHKKLKRLLQPDYELYELARRKFRNQLLKITR